MLLFFFYFLWRVPTLEPSDRREHRVNFNTMELEVNTHKMSLYPIGRTKKKCKQNRWGSAG